MFCYFISSPEYALPAYFVETFLSPHPHNVLIPMHLLLGHEGTGDNSEVLSRYLLSGTCLAETSRLIDKPDYCKKYFFITFIVNYVIAIKVNIQVGKMIRSYFLNIYFYLKVVVIDGSRKVVLRVGDIPYQVLLREALSKVALEQFQHGTVHVASCVQQQRQRHDVKLTWL